MFFLERFQKILFNLTRSREFLVAYSGGMDSHVLLHSLVQLRDQDSDIKVRAVHVHHNLSVNADSWVKHCRQVCKQLNVELIVCYVDAKKIAKKGYSLEAVARELRYNEIANILLPKENLVTAHHLDDQGETVLLQLFRGAGVRGLSAMPKIKQFFHGQHLRPLLNFSRAQLHQYAKQNATVRHVMHAVFLRHCCKNAVNTSMCAPGVTSCHAGSCNNDPYDLYHALRAEQLQQNRLHWIEDESNENVGFDRNYVRHNLLQKIIERWPGALNCLSRSAQNCAEASQMLDEMASNDLELVAGRDCSANNHTLSISALLKLSQVRLNNVLRYWFLQLNLSPPSRAKLQQIRSTVLCCRQDAMPLVSWGNVEVRRYRDDIYAMKSLKPFDSSVVLNWNCEKPIQLPGDLGLLRPEVLRDYGVDIDNVTVRFRDARSCPSLKKRFQELGVPPWLRDRVPLIYLGDKLLAILHR